jgi:hypothetical protein
MVEYCSIGNVTLLYYVSSVTYGLQTQNDGPRRRTRVMCLGEVSGRSPFFHGPRQNLIGFPCSLLMLTDCFPSRQHRQTVALLILHDQSSFALATGSMVVEKSVTTILIS